MVDSYSWLCFADYGSASQISQQMVAMTSLIATHRKRRPTYTQITKLYTVSMGVHWLRHAVLVLHVTMFDELSVSTLWRTKPIQALDLMASNEVWSSLRMIQSNISNKYPLVNVYITMERSTMVLMGKSAISMAIFNSYVKLAEGRFSQCPRSVHKESV